MHYFPGVPKHGLRWVHCRLSTPPCFSWPSSRLLFFVAILDGPFFVSFSWPFFFFSSHFFSYLRCRSKCFRRFHYISEALDTRSITPSRAHTLPQDTVLTHTTLLRSIPCRSLRPPPSLPPQVQKAQEQEADSPRIRAGAPETLREERLRRGGGGEGAGCRGHGGQQQRQR